MRLTWGDFHADDYERRRLVVRLERFGRSGVSLGRLASIAAAQELAREGRARIAIEDDAPVAYAVAATLLRPPEGGAA